MIKRLFVIAVLGVAVSGCFMAPLALIGPISSGFSTASLIQTGVTTGANYVVKKSTGKTIAEHAMQSITKDIFKQSYFPTNKQIYLPENEFSAKCKKYDYYCKRMSRKEWFQYINQNKSLLGSS